MKRRPETIIVMVSALLAVLTAGCQGGGIAGADATLPAGQDSAELLDQISSQRNVSENQALRGILYLLDGRDDNDSFAGRVEALQNRAIVPACWDFDANRPLTKGKLAYMVYQACGVPGGLTLKLTGPTQRYCLRELQYQGMISSGSWYTPVTGMEYVAVLSRAAAYMETGHVPQTMKVDWRR